ncbi:MAG: proprotein convertase P-domain-containing protein [Marinomonas sp.]
MLNKLSLIIRLCIAAIVLFLTSQPDLAQAVFTYSNTVDATIDGSTTCAAPVSRTFVVGDTFTISDVDIGIFAEHTWRGDLQFTLRSPAGTTVQLTNGNTNSVSGDNFNVLLNDGGTQVVNTDGNTVNHSTVAPPPFANDFIPDNPLSAFNGETSNGTWTLEMCDLYPTADDGDFRYAELRLTSLPATYADLSLTKNVSSPTPTAGSAITYTLSVTNAANSTATGVTVTDVLPLGFTFSSSSGFGSYNAGTGIWTIGSIAVGQTRTLTISGTVDATPGATIINNAEVTTSSLIDIDSTPGNNSPAEDDFDTASFTVQGARTAGIPPILSCPAGQNLFNWDTTTWVAGSTNNTYAMAGFGDVNFSITNQGTWVNDPAFGGLSPSIAQANSGGIAVVEDSLHQYIDFANQSQTATTTLALPNGIAGAQFTIFDIDFAAGDFADKLTVTGSYKGATTIPTLTNGVVNYVAGNSAIGDGASGGTSSDGNVVVTFTSAVDTIVITYGNHTTAPAVPDGQAMAIHDFNFCAPDTELAVTKTSTVFSDPVNNTTDPKAIPGALVEYTIGVSNPGISDADADSVFVVDTVPADSKMCIADIGGSGPVNFIDGATTSDLAYTFVSIANLGDDLQFSDDNGTSWDFVPTADADGCDAAITNFRVNPKGAFSGDGSFNLRARFLVE